MKTANFSAQCSRLRSPITDKAFFSLQCHSAFIRLLDDSFPEYLTFDPDTRSLLTETCIKEGWGGLTRTSTASLNEGGYTILKKIVLKDNWWGVCYILSRNFTGVCPWHLQVSIRHRIHMPPLQKSP